MPRTSPYLVPTDVLADQGQKTAALFDEDKPAHKQLLASAGLRPVHFTAIKEHSTSLLASEVTQEERKDAHRQEQAEATEAGKAVLRWRLDEVLPRARVVFESDHRLELFRSGKLRSTRPGAVVAEGQRLVGLIQRFDRLPEAKAIGLDNALAAKGEALIATLAKEALDDDVALERQRESTEELRQMEGELAGMLADVEKRMTIAFPSDHPARRRYRMNDIRTYVARQHGKGGTDPSAAITVPDPLPDVSLEPVDA